MVFSQSSGPVFPKCLFVYSFGRSQGGVRSGSQQVARDAHAAEEPEHLRVPGPGSGERKSEVSQKGDGWSKRLMPNRAGARENPGRAPGEPWDSPGAAPDSPGESRESPKEPRAAPERPENRSLGLSGTLPGLSRGSPGYPPRGAAVAVLARDGNQQLEDLDLAPNHLQGILLFLVFGCVLWSCFCVFLLVHEF